MFDLIIFPLSLDAGREQYELPGLLVVSATRKSARMRAQDHLALYCKLHTIAGGSAGGVSSAQPAAAITPVQLREILTRLADTYFTFSGSITAGLRMVAARLNDFLLNRNLKAAQEGQTVGTLNMAVMHGERLVVAHVGATHSYVLVKNDVLHFDDGQAGRGLGLSRQIVPRFYQASVESGDLLVLCADPPASWNARSLANSPQLSFDHLRRRLTSDAGVDLQAGIVRFQAGKGQISYWRPGENARAAGKLTGDERQAARQAAPSPQLPGREAAARNDPAVAPPPVVDALPKIAPAQVSPAEESFALPESTPDPAGQDTTTPAPGIYLSGSTATPEPGQAAPLSPLQAGPARSSIAVQAPSQRTVTAEGTATPRPGVQRVQGKSAAQLKKEKRPPVDRSVARKPGAFQRTLAATRGKIGSGMRKAGFFWIKTGRVISTGFARLIPRQFDSQGRVIPFFNLSPAQMLAIAIFVPLIVVAVGTTVYARLGLADQFQDRLTKAQAYAQQAAQLNDPVQRRESWKQAYALLLDAERVGNNEESVALKKQIVAALDEFEKTVRLDYQPAVSGGFPPDVNITGMAATLNDVYLLDSSQGRILRLYRTSSGYEVDPKFNCGAGTAGTIIINPLIDLAAMPPNNEMHSTVMGIDAAGNLVYCAPNLTGFDSRPLALPDSGWGNIVGITLSGNTLYVLDPKANAVYRYDGVDGVFTDPPHLYFDSTIPKMDDVIDLAVDPEFLYLLHADGRMTVCESSGFTFAATKCTDPAPYGDSRPGYEPAPLAFAGAQFSHIQTTQPPEPSLFALDAANKSIYHLSLHWLNLQRQFRPVPDGNFPLPNQAATAFAITPNRRVLIAFGNNLFFAPMP